MSRFQIVDSPVALPGCCFGCGAANKKWYVDTGRSIEFHGAVYFCNDCITEIAHEAEFMSPEKANQVKFELDKLEREVFDLRLREQALEKTVHGLVDAGYSFGSSVPDNIGNLALDTPISEPDSSGAENQLGEDGRTPVESSEHENVGKLRSDDEPAGFSLDL